MTYAAPRRAYPAGMVRFTAALPLIDWSRTLHSMYDIVDPEQFQKYRHS